MPSWISESDSGSPSRELLVLILCITAFGAISMLGLSIPLTGMILLTRWSEVDAKATSALAEVFSPPRNPCKFDLVELF